MLGSVSPDSMLEAVDVAKTYADGTAALAGVSLAVAPGETVALVGESGSGKTTLLRTFNRMVDPSAGTVRIEGKSAAGLDPIALRRRIGYVPQDGGLIPPLADRAPTSSWSPASSAGTPSAAGSGRARCWSWSD